MQLIKKLHDPILSRRKEKLTEGIRSILPTGTSKIADIGCGDGEIGCRLSKDSGATVEGWDIHPREQCHIPHHIFDGKSLPLEDNSVDVTLLIDVLHHDNNPQIILKEAARVAKFGVIIKDHLCENQFDHSRLSFMDWVGNRHYGVRLPYNYLSQRQWNELFENCGLKKTSTVPTLELYSQPLETVFGGNLHFISLLSK